MRVLWFTNTPSLAAAHFNLPVIGGGWIQSLETAVTQSGQLELGIAFRFGEEKLQKINSQTTYYAMPTLRKGRLEGFLARHRGSLDTAEMLAYCMQVIDDFKPDLINVFGTEDAFGLIAGKVPVPVVIHIQGILTVYDRKWTSAGVSHRDVIRQAGWKELLKANSLYHFYKRFRNAAIREQQIYAGCRYFMGRTHWDKRISLVLSPGSVYFHCEESLRKSFYAREWSYADNKKKVLVSTIQSNIYKGLETVLEAAALLKKNNTFPFIWKIAGIGADDRLIQLFEKKTGLSFSEQHIELCGGVSEEKLIAMEMEADIFVHPSHIDNSPNSVCEAMLLGMPVIATGTGGTGSLLEDGKEGVLIQDGDPWAMAGAVTELIQNPEQAIAMGRLARTRAMSRHDQPAIVNRLLQIYKNILQLEKQDPLKSQEVVSDHE